MDEKEKTMKVQELRDLLRASDRACLEKAFVECYKELRKGQKEEVDPVITDILKGMETSRKKAEAPADFNALKEQITVFIENAYAQNYFAPNRIIPKSQRPKWRFLVKNFIKELEKIPPEDSNHSQAVKLLTDLYCLICEACNYYLFSTDDPFRSIGWEQPKFFELVVGKNFANGYPREDISRLLLCAVTGGLSRESLHIMQEIVFLNGLKTSDVKYIAIEEADKLVKETMPVLQGLKEYDNKRYDLKEKINELCRMILMLTISLSEPEKGIEYYFKNSQESRREITLYSALDTVRWIGDDGLWIQVYEYGIKKKIKPRDSLRVAYEAKKNPN